MRKRNRPRKGARRGSSDRRRKGPGWEGILGGLILGSVFSAFGGLLLLFERGLIRSAKGSARPPGLLFGFGAAMLGAGLGIFMGFGLVPLWKHLCRKRRIALHPDAPWYADHDWDASGTVSGALRETLVKCAYAPFFLLFALPLHWHYPLAAVAVDILVPLPVIVLFARRLKYGKSRLRFETFPFFLGEKLKARLVLSRPLDQFASLKIDLACTRESRRTTSWETYRGHRVVRGFETEELYTDSHTIDEPGTRGASRWEFPVEFDVPEGRFETDLGSTPRTSWVLKVTGDAPGLDYEAQFLVPVYARPD